jgi:endoglucanase
VTHPFHLSPALTLTLTTALLAGCSLSHTPNIKLNQLGYLPQSSKVAVVESEGREPLGFQVLDGTGKVVVSGQTQPRGSDKESGDELHHADFSSLSVPGKGYHLVVDGDQSYAFSVDSNVYASLKDAALAYFYHNRSGTPIEVPWAGQWQWTHGPGHLSDADVGCIND